MAHKGVFKDESQKTELLAFMAASFWILQLASAALMILATTEVKENSDQYYWFTLQDPGGGSLSYPILCITYFRLLHLISGENIVLFMQVAALFSFLFFLATLLVFHRMGINPGKILLFSILALPVLLILTQRVETIPIFLSSLAVWLFYSGKRTEGWIALLAGALFKVFPLLFAPLFLAMELKNFNRGSVLRLSVFALLALLAFFISQDNMNTVLFTSGRGIQVESTYSAVLLIANHFLGLGITVEHNYGAEHLVLPPYLDSLPLLAMGIQALSILAISALFFLKGAKKEGIFVYAFLVATAMVLFSKVFSAQFILWPLIFAIPILAIPWKSPKFQSNLFLFLILLLCSVFSYLAYPALYVPLIHLEPAGIAALAARNALLMIAFAWVLLNKEKFYLKTDSK